MEDITDFVYYGPLDGPNLVSLFRATLEGSVVRRGEVLGGGGWEEHPELAHLPATGEAASVDLVSADQALAYLIELAQGFPDVPPGPDWSQHQPWRSLYEGFEAPDIPRTCPRCGWTRVVPVLWGYPDGKAIEAMYRGEAALAGCLLPERGEAWMCLVCCQRGGDVALWHQSA